MNQKHPSTYPSMGEVIDGKYQIERMLGEGGMGAVAKATHLLRRAPVALKFMSPNVVAVSGAVERFLNEGVAASAIDSDHVVHVYDVGKLPNGAPYLVMEYMEGCDLADLLAREGRPGLDIPRAVHFTVQTLRGLQVAHDSGVIHRDMKPSNCFVIHKEGEDDFVKLLDFGISKVQQGKSASLTQTNSALGTPLYMSPEQARSPRDVDHRSDLYSVAVILYELLTGRTPFTSESGEFTEILFKLFTAEPPPIRSLRPDVPEGLAAVVHRGLARDVRDRFANAGEFGIALEPWTDARSAQVITRLKAHAHAHQGRRASQVTPAAQADPARQFSKLQTGSMARIADTDPPPPAPPTAHSPNQFAPPQTPPGPSLRGGAQASPAQTPQPNTTPARHSAFPPAAGNRASSAAEAVAATQYHTPSIAPSNPPPQTPVPPQHTQHLQAGAHTDLGASRDASPPREKRPSPLIFAAPVVILAIVGVGAWKLTRPSGPAPATAEPAPATALVTAAPPPTPPAPLSASAPSATPIASAPSAALIASASAAPPPSAAPTHTPAATKTTPHPPPSNTGHLRLKDLKPVE